MDIALELLDVFEPLGLRVEDEQLLERRLHGRNIVSEALKRCARNVP